MSEPLRIGTLGAASITPKALIEPAHRLPGVEVVAIAARDPLRAEAFAQKHRIPRRYTSYDALIDDPAIDAIYNPLPNSAHAEWTIKALRAGKHVLCEKPLASNADEAVRMAAVAQETGRVMMEAFHWRHHPLADQMRRIIATGELGAIRHVDANMCIPLPLPKNIRYDYALAGGATMDTGCYAINMVRMLSGQEPTVRSAEARLWGDQIDRWMTAELELPGGVPARATCSLLSSTLLKIDATVRGERGTMRAINPVAPHLWHRLHVETSDGSRTVRVPGDTTYTHQLRDFIAAVRGAPLRWGPDDAIANMRVIDAVYDAAGLKRRGI
jgi:predicted dehydrogenase